MDALSLATKGFLVSDIMYVEKEPIILYGRLQIMQQKHYVGDVGKTIIINCGEDISGATSTKIKVKKPDGTTATWNASVYAMGGRYNYIKYVTLGSDVVAEDVDAAIGGTKALSRIPPNAESTTVKLYQGVTLVDTLVKTSGTEEVETLTGTSGADATLNLRTGVLSIEAHGVTFNHAKADYSSPSDFSVSGKYELQAYIEKGDFRGYGTTDYLVISELFD